jgi:hypothetical protein
LKVLRDGRLVTVEVMADGEGLVSHSGSALLAEVADKTGLTRASSGELGGLRRRRGGHDVGRVFRDLAVMVADGGDCLADLRADPRPAAVVRAGRFGRHGVPGHRRDRQRP